MVSQAAAMANLSTISGSNFSDDDCPYGYDAVSVLAGVNLTDEKKLAWPCLMREFWHQIAPLRHLTEGLLFYGTVIVIAVGLLLNMLSFRVLCTPQLRKHSSNLYLLALSMYDSCVLIFNFMVGVMRGQSADTINRLFQETEWLCILHSVGVELFNLLSIWMIVCLSVERLIVVIVPFKAARYCNVKKARITIVAMSLLILAISCHKTLMSGFEGDSVFGYKACHTHRKIVSHALFFYVAFNTWLPTVTIMTVNAIITSKIRKAGIIRNSMSASTLQSSQTVTGQSSYTIASQSSQSIAAPAKIAHVVSAKDMKLIMTMKAVAATYLALVLPLGIIQSLELLWNNMQKTTPSLNSDQQRDFIYYQQIRFVLKYIRTIAFFLYQCNFSVNFFVYFVRNSRFRLALQKMFPCLPIPNSLKKSCSSYQLSSSTNSTALGSSG